MPQLKFDAGSRDRDWRLADRVRDLVARLESIRAQDRLDAERWADDGGGVDPEPMALTPTRRQLVNSSVRDGQDARTRRS